MMKLDLSVLLNKVDNVVPFEGEIVESDLNNKLKMHKITGPIKYNGQVIKAIDGLHLDMKILYSYETNCARCLEIVKENVETSLSGKLEEIQESYEDNTDEDIVIENYDVPIYYSNGILDLDEYVLMEVTSSLPMRTLCMDNCKGLCKVCGTDLNKDTCSCDTDFIDPRFEKLKNLVIED